MVLMNSRFLTALRSGAVIRPVVTVLIALLLAAVCGRAAMVLSWIDFADRSVVLAANGSLGTVNGALAEAVDVLFGPRSAVLLLVLSMAGIIALRRDVLAGVHAGVLIVLPWGAAELLKIIVGRPRPDAPPLAHQLVVPPDSFSFPSGHTAFAAALCCAILLLLRPGRGRRAGVVLAVVVVAVTAWSRVALGVHHPTDVLASAVLVPVLAVSLSSLLNVLLPLRGAPSRPSPSRPGGPTEPPDPGSGGMRCRRSHKI